jgi:hypothetical protein
MRSHIDFAARTSPGLGKWVFACVWALGLASWWAWQTLPLERPAPALVMPTPPDGLSLQKDSEPLALALAAIREQKLSPWPEALKVLETAPRNGVVLNAIRVDAKLRRTVLELDAQAPESALEFVRDLNQDLTHQPSGWRWVVLSMSATERSAYRVLVEGTHVP